MTNKPQNDGFEEAASSFSAHAHTSEIDGDTQREFLERLSETLPCAAFLYRLDPLTRKFGIGNRAGLIGFTSDEIAEFENELIDELCHPDDYQSVLDKFRSLKDLADGEVTQPIEYRIRHKDGRYVWFSTVFSAYDRTPEGVVDHVIGVAMDITNSRETEIELQQTKRFLERLTDLMPNMVYIFNRQLMRNEYANRSIGHLTGYTPQDVQGMKSGLMDRLLHPDDKERVFQNFAANETLKDGESSSIEYRLRHRDGSYKWFVSHDAPFDRDEDGNILRFIGVAAEISETKKAEARLSEMNSNLEQEVAERTAEIIGKNTELTNANALLNAIVQTAYSAIIALDRNGNVITLNDSARHILGGVMDETPFPWPDDIKFLEIENLVPLEQSLNPITRALAGQSIKNETSVMTRRGGQTNRYVRVNTSHVADPGVPITVVAILDDISEQENARQQYERSSRLDALGQLTGGIAHDFNNLLATIQYSIELASREAKAENVRNLLNTSLGAVDRGAALSRRLLAFARRQPGLAQSRNMKGLLAEFMQLIEPTIEKAIEVKAELSGEDLVIHCDQGQLENSMLNLMLNARDAIVRSGKGNMITVSVRDVEHTAADSAVVVPAPHSYRSDRLQVEKLDDDRRHDNAAYRYIEIAVTDNGPGMSEEVKRRAIDPFFTTKDTNSGTGLGLSMVYGFVQQSHGELRLYSEEGVGTTVRMMLPRGTPEGQREMPVQRAAISKGKGERIFIVEDEPILLEMLTKTIEHLGYETVGAANGAVAISMIEAGEPFDLLLTDIVMPGGISGFKLAAQARSARPDCKVVYMSGYTGYQENEMGQVVAKMLAKPCPESLLAESIRSELDGVVA